MPRPSLATALLASILLTMAACGREKDTADTAPWVDADGDGYGADEDCDDIDSAVNPGATELCNLKDDDCDGEIDEPDAADAPTWYADADGDGHGDPGAGIAACQAPSGCVAQGGDCDDGDAAVNPAATELCDGVDNDCDGTEDEPDAADAATWYADADDDGYGDAASTAPGCTQPRGYVADATDCDDTDAGVSPRADERCDGVDDDCDGAVDEDDAIDAPTWYPDHDLDGHGDDGHTQVGCAQPEGWVAAGDDCDDHDASVHPGADETCDGEDDDCDGTVDEGDAIDAPTWYADTDADGYGDPAAPQPACTQPSGYAAAGTDCDDTLATVNPGAAEWCNGVDDDCSGVVDEPYAADAPTWYLDADLDGYGGPATSTSACAQPGGYAAAGTDCDDGDPAISPGATELCDGVDNDCSGVVDEPYAADALTWYADADTDGYGDAASTTAACTVPSGFVGDDTDCDDGEAGVNPGADELCDGVDDDCDGLVDEPDALDARTWYLDADGDGYGVPTGTAVACAAPSGYAASRTDCDDADAGVHPGATELCDGVDDDCDGVVDEGGAADALTWYADRDGDGTGDPSAGVRACSLPSGHTDNAWDCDDLDPNEPRIADASSGASTGDGSLAAPYDTIQAAISAATACVRVLPGTYLENLDLGGRDLEVVGLEGPDATIIDGGGAGSVLTVASGERGAVLQGFTLRDGAAEQGGGVFLDGADLTLLDIDIQGCASVAEGGGVYVHEGTLQADALRVHDNTAEAGGGIYLDTLTTAGLTSSLIAGNTSTHCCGGLGAVDGTVVTLSNTVVAGNSAGTYGGGLGLETGVVLTLSYGALVGNSGAHGGGAVISDYSLLQLVGSILADNTATVTADGVKYLHPTVSASYTWCDLVDDFGTVTVPVGRDGNIASPPAFLDISAADPLLWDLHLDPASALIDAADPSEADPDGSCSDIGPYGGAGAGSWDLDGDGWPQWWQPGAYDSATYPALGWDCDDMDPAVYPGAGC
ncbi:MAG: MopE-related protein [Pseudomonadota bacterium]